MKNISGLFKTIAVILMMGWFIADKIVYPPQKRLKNKYFQLSYYGVVKENYVDYEDHARRVIVLDNDRKIFYPTAIDYLYSITEIGDTLQKTEGEFRGYLKKRDTTIIIDYDISTE